MYLNTIVFMVTSYKQNITFSIGRSMIDYIIMFIITIWNHKVLNLRTKGEFT